MEKVVLITGCSSGIGFETALQFARNKHLVFATVRDLNSNEAKKLIQISQKEILNLKVIGIDVTSEIGVRNGIHEVLKQTQRMDILVNNAGFGFLGTVEESSIEEIKNQYETNIFGYLRMIKAVLPIMRKQKSGMIINLSSINGLLSFPLWGVYSSSKYAIETLSEALSFEVYPFGIKVALVEPGSFLTRFGYNRKHPKAQGGINSAYKKLTDSFFKNYDRAHNIKNPLLGKLIDPKRVAKKIFEIGLSDNPSLRNVIGVDAHLYLFLKKLIPESLKLWMFRKIYGWG